MNIAKQATLLFISLLMLTGTGWYFSNSSPKLELDKNTLLNMSDTVITHLNVRQYSPTGSLANSLQSPLMRHIPKNNTHWIKTPNITIIQPNQSIWEINAEQATALYGGQKITFNKQVRIHQNKSEHNEESTVTTERLTYFPKTKIALTSKNVFLEQAGSKVQSKGMRANLEKKHIQLLGQARGIYDPNHG